MSPRDRILARRASFVAAALTSIAGCSSSDPSGPPDEVRDTGAQPCLSADATFDTGAQVCLAPDSPPQDTTLDDTSTKDTAVSDAREDTGPMPCLAPPPGDTG